MVSGEMHLFDQKEAAKVVMLDECVMADMFEVEENDAHKDYKSESHDSMASDENKNDKKIDDLLSKINPDVEEEIVKPQETEIVSDTKILVILGEGIFLE